MTTNHHNLRRDPFALELPIYADPLEKQAIWPALLAAGALGLAGWGAYDLFKHNIPGAYRAYRAGDRAGMWKNIGWGALNTVGMIPGAAAITKFPKMMSLAAKVPGAVRGLGAVSRLPNWMTFAKPVSGVGANLKLMAPTATAGLAMGAVGGVPPDQRPGLWSMTTGQQSQSSKPLPFFQQPGMFQQMAQRYANMPMGAIPDFR